MSTTSLSTIDQETPLKEYFVNAEVPRNKFNAVLTGKDQIRILNIYGGVGLGKSSLLEIFRMRCKAERIPVALTNGNTAKDSVGVLGALADALRQSGIQLCNFDGVRTRYQTVRRSATEHALQAAETVTIERPAVFSDGMVDALSTLPIQPEDIELYRQGAARLTREFQLDLEAAKPRRIVLMIDRWEMFASGDTGEWFRDLLRTMPSNILVVVAGRKRFPAEQAWSVSWPTWPRAFWFHEMHPLNETALRMELVKRFTSLFTGGQAAPNADMATKMCDWSQGNPALLCFALRYWNTQGHFNASETMVVQDTYDRLLDGVSSELKSLLEIAAVFRSFTRETLRAVVPSGQKDAVWQELSLQSPFFHQFEDGKWSVVQPLRDNLNEKLWKDDHQRFVDLHREAGNHCADQEKALSSSMHSDQQQNEILYWKLELLYHRFKENERLGLNTFRAEFEDAFFRRRNFDDCSAIWNEFSSYALDAEASQLARYYQGLTAIYREKDPKKSAEILESLRSEPPCVDTLHADVLEYLAAIYWYYNQLGDGGTEKASKLYVDCLTLRKKNCDAAGQARVKTWMGILVQRLQGEGKSCFEEALNLCKSLPEGQDTDRIRAWANQELSISDRMKGHFKDSEEKITSSIRTFETLKMQFDTAGARFNYASLLIWRGRLHTAEDELNMIDQLYHSSPRSRIQEKAWIKIGFGNVALGRHESQEAADMFCGVKKLGEEQNDHFVQSLGLGGMAECCVSEGKWDDALKFGKDCLELQNQTKDKFGRGYSLHNLGLAYAGKQDFEHALDCLNQGLSVMRDYGSRFGISLLLSVYCKVYAQAGNYTKFRETAEKLREFEGDRFYDHLATVAFAEGMRALSDPKFGRQPGPCLADAFQNAIEYSPFLLERMLTELLEILKIKSRRKNIKILNDVVKKWVKQKMPEREKKRQGEEYAAERERITLLDRIRKEYPEVRIPKTSVVDKTLKVLKGMIISVKNLWKANWWKDSSVPWIAIAVMGMIIVVYRKDPTVLVAAITVTGAIIVGYWQFHKPASPSPETVQLRELMRDQDKQDGCSQRQSRDY